MPGICHCRGCPYGSLGLESWSSLLRLLIELRLFTVQASAAAIGITWCTWTTIVASRVVCTIAASHMSTVDGQLSSSPSSRHLRLVICGAD
jgi:hypothetical protein